MSRGEDIHDISRNTSLTGSLERLELEPASCSDDEYQDECGEHDGLFPDASAGLRVVESERCCAPYVPRSRIARVGVLLSVVLNVYLVAGILIAPDGNAKWNFVKSGNDDENGNVYKNDLGLDKHNGNANPDLPCAVLLSTFPNSGTTWTQAVFKSSTGGLVSEAVYNEGPPTPYPGIYVHGSLGPATRLPDSNRGECLFVKSHARVSYTSMGPSSQYQRAVVLYRDPEDNLDANLRYLTKLPVQNRGKAELRSLCPGNIDTFDEDNWKTVDPDGYDMFTQLHFASHERFYCHAQQYPMPKLFVTYARLLNDPYGTFRDIMLFSGYPEANITKALEENPPRSHTAHGSLEYVPVGDGGNGKENEDCAGLTDRYKKLWKNATPCTRRAAQILQYT